MAEIIYKTAYLSLTIPLSGALASIQEEVCKRYTLFPRPETHLTIAFFGEITASKLVDLAASLIDILPSADIANIHIDGLGGAHKSGDDLTLIHGEMPDELTGRPRVLWLALSVDSEIYAFRQKALMAAETLGISTRFNGPDFYPHLTLGSAGPTDQGDWTLWDVHTVPKRATIDMQLPVDTLRASKLHLTDVPISPDSVHLLRPIPMQ